ncbi:DUF559 domain-containing protein [Leucobacter viscericola]|uniref:DUF559 domain-containing protein n=1 Tax=Leucobacter viscericola TaxID=2714935 RepID=A0A6G7XD18_9MICO|nr:DUF559 domain-containing protein [Leucobacter viscericola]QIK62268.1 DUF559 domain-containing protein [Leucobacter viscericola]
MQLSEELQTSAFTISTGMRAGLTPRAAQHSRFAHPHHGVRKLKVDRPRFEFDEIAARQLARDYLPLLRPREAFSHTTALLLMQVPLRTPAQLHVTAPKPMGQARGRNVRGHRVSREFTPIKDLEGLPCVPYLQALLQSIPMLRFRELVVALDHLRLLRGPPGVAKALLPQEEVMRHLQEHSVIGAARLRAAIEVSRVGAESRMESLQHFELARMGIDTLEMQAEIFSEAGVLIGRFDLVDRETKRIVEYDGEQHRTDRLQYLRDEERLENAREEGWKILRLRKENFHDRELAATRRILCDFLLRVPKTLPPRLTKYFAEPLYLSSLRPRTQALR